MNVPVTCSECYALVDPDHQAAHDHWHQLETERVSRVAWRVRDWAGL